MGDLKFAAATEEDIPELVWRMRPLDQDEMRASSGSDFEGALRRSLAVSDDPVSLRQTDGRLVALFGVAPHSLLSETAYPWLIGTKLMRANAGPVLRYARGYIEFARERYPRLVNYVDARNGPSIRWLRRIGFTIDPPAPHGVMGLPFHRFHLGLDDV